MATRSKRYVYLHGFASSPLSRKARFFRQRLAEAGIDLEVPALDAGDFEHLTISGQLGLIARLLAGDPAVMMGSSMGGYLAALYAGRHPEVERLVLLAPAFGFAERWEATFGEEMVAEWRTRGYADVYHYGAGTTRRLSVDLLNDAREHPAFPVCPQPSLVFHGRTDDVVPLEASVRWVRENPKAQLVELDSDHELLDALDRVWGDSQDFLLEG